MNSFDVFVTKGLTVNTLLVCLFVFYKIRKFLSFSFYNVLEENMFTIELEDPKSLIRLYFIDMSEILIRL